MVRWLECWLSSHKVMGSKPDRTISDVGKGTRSSMLLYHSRNKSLAHYETLMKTLKTNVNYVNLQNIRVLGF